MCGASLVTGACQLVLVHARRGALVVNEGCRASPFAGLGFGCALHFCTGAKLGAFRVIPGVMRCVLVPVIGWLGDLPAVQYS